VSNYFTPDFFAPSYFRLVSPFSAPRGDGGGYRDSDAYSAILSALVATGEFAAVEFAPGGGGEPSAIAADVDPLIFVVPGAWRESDDADPAYLLRFVGYTLTLTVRDENAITGFARLDRLGAVVQNALDGSTLGGGCLPGLTRVGRGAYDPKSPYPDRRLSLEGEFAYRIARSGRDTTT
jgi:hypothetical protein